MRMNLVVIRSPSESDLVAVQLPKAPMLTLPNDLPVMVRCWILRIKPTLPTFFCIRVSCIGIGHDTQ